MIDRRDLLARSGALGVASAFGSSPAAAATRRRDEPRGGDHEPQPIPLNRARASKVMDEHGLDGLVAVDERNVFYSTNLWPLFSKMVRPHPTLAVIPRREDLPVIAVVPATEIWTTTRETRRWPQMIVYTAPASDEEYRAYLAKLPGEHPSAPPEAPKGVGLGYWKAREEPQLSSYEERLEANLGRYSAEAAASWQTGLIRALTELGLLGGKLGFDDRGIMAEMGEHLGAADSYRSAGNIFRQIRVVKSPFEIDQMRLAARANAAAAMATAAQVQVGATEAEIEAIFYSEAGKRGAIPVFVVLDTVGGLSRGEVQEGQPIMIDAVSQRDYYHGDFGRTIVVGEPTRELHRRSKAIETAWTAALDMMEPGVRYSQIREAATRAVDLAGLGEFDFRVTPHSVGLQHTDEPIRFDSAVPAKDDLMLEEGMTMTVDFPMVSPGWGSCHLEDLVLVTKDGVEPLNDLGHNVIVI